MTRPRFHPPRYVDPDTVRTAWGTVAPSTTEHPPIPRRKRKEHPVKARFNQIPGIRSPLPEGMSPPPTVPQYTHLTDNPVGGDWHLTACSLTHARAGSFTSGLAGVTCPECLKRAQHRIDLNDPKDYRMNPIKNSLDHMDNPGSRWDTGEYRIERICTCCSRSADCGPDRYHCVDSYMSADVAFAETTKLNLQTNLPSSPCPYIVVQRSTGKRAWRKPGP